MIVNKQIKKYVDKSIKKSLKNIKNIKIRKVIDKKSTKC